MERRRFLALTGTSMVVGAAGCSGSTGNGTSTAPTEDPAGTGTTTGAGTDTPQVGNTVKAPVRAYWDAYNDNDLDAMREQIHPSSPNGPSESDVSFEETVTVESVDVRTESEPNATVDVRAKRGDQSESSLLVFQMRTERTENGLTWYIWSDDTFTDGYSGLKAPTPFFDYDYDRDATDSDDTTVVTVSNASDPIDATLLSIRGTGFVNPAGASPEVTEGGTTWAEATGDQQIDFGDEVTIGVASGYEVNFVWEYEGVTSTVESFEDI